MGDGLLIVSAAISRLLLLHQNVFDSIRSRLQFSSIPSSSCVDLMVDFDYGSHYFGENFAKEVQSKEDKEATTKIPVDAFLC